MPRKPPAEKTTVKGRLVHVDRFLIRNQGLKRFRKRPLSYLDVGCGATKGGAPTTEDTLRVFRRAGIQIKLTAIDKGYPRGLKRKPEITYVRLNITRKPIEGQFGVVRYINVESHLPEKEKKAAFRRVFESVAEGGYLIYSADPFNYLIFRKSNGKLSKIKTFKSKEFHRLDRMNIAFLKKQMGSG